MQVLAVGNQKGGTSKTTTAAVLAVLLSRRGVPVHVVDMDPQASLTSALGRHDEEGGLFLSLAERKPLSVVRLTEHLTLTPSSVDLARGETEFLSEPGRESILQVCLEKTDLPKEGIVILDSPPSLGVLALNCLTATDQLLVAVQPGGFEVQAMARLQQSVAILKERVNPRLKIVGVVLTNCHVRRSITEQVRAELGRLYPVLGMVRTDAKLLYATTEGTLLNLKNSRALEDYSVVVEKLKTRLRWPVRSAA